MQKDYKGALIQICIATARTSKDNYPTIKDDSVKFPKFLDKNAELIMLAITNGKWRMTKMPKFYFPHPKIKAEDKMATLSEIIYQIRCTLIHEAEIPKEINFMEEIIFECKDDKIKLPLTILDGLILSVIGATTNSKEYLSGDPNYRGVKINDYWGEKGKIMSTFFPMPDFFQKCKDISSSKDICGDAESKKNTSA